VTSKNRRRKSSPSNIFRSCCLITTTTTDLFQLYYRPYRSREPLIIYCANQEAIGPWYKKKTMLDVRGASMATTFTTATTPIRSQPTDQPLRVFQGFFKQVQDHSTQISMEGDTQTQNSSSTINGVVIGLLSSFGSALLVFLIFVIVWFFRYTNPGRILLDRIGRPGEYDDEQAYLKEEAEALETMDDIQRVEYQRAKGRLRYTRILYFSLFKERLTDLMSQHSSRQIRPIRYPPTSHYLNI